MDQECKVCLMKLGSTRELLPIGIKEQNIKDDNKIKRSDIQDLNEVKINEDMKRVDIKEKDLSFVFSESKFFDEFL